MVILSSGELSYGAGEFAEIRCDAARRQIEPGGSAPGTPLHSAGQAKLRRSCGCGGLQFRERASPANEARPLESDNSSADGPHHLAAVFGLKVPFSQGSP
jgi:hypothetical protein